MLAAGSRREGLAMMLDMPDLPATALAESGVGGCASQERRFQGSAGSQDRAEEGAQASRQLARQLYQASRFALPPEALRTVAAGAP